MEIDSRLELRAGCAFGADCVYVCVGTRVMEMDISSRGLKVGEREIQC